MARYLGDKSALSRVHHDDVLHRLAAHYLAGDIATCTLVDLEILQSARTAEDHRAVQGDRRLLPRVPCGDDVLERAVEVQERLAETGRHRLPVDVLVIAAAAEAAGLTVLHYDGDFDVVAEVTGQATEWVVPAGTVP